LIFLGTWFLLHKWMIKAAKNKQGIRGKVKAKIRSRSATSVTGATQAVNEETNDG
jgi:hypothetical protein